MPALDLDLTIDLAEPDVDDADLAVCAQQTNSVLSYPYCC